MVCTTLPQVDKAGTSLVEIPTAQALVAQLKSKASYDNLIDDDAGLLNFTVAESKIICRVSSLLSMSWPDPGKPDCPVWYSGWFLILSHENVKGSL
jgi:hypothetical protein